MLNANAPPFRPQQGPPLSMGNRPSSFGPEIQQQPNCNTAVAAGAGAAQSTPLQGHHAKLFVGQLPYECDEAQLHEIFGAYGEIMSIHVHRDQRNTPTGAAFVTFATTAEADTAIFTLHDRYRLLSNKAIQVSYAKHSPSISAYGLQTSAEVHRQCPRSNPLPDPLQGAGVNKRGSRHR